MYIAILELNTLTIIRYIYMVISMTEIAKEQPVLTVYYWPMMGRAGATVRMLEHTGTPYKHVSDSSNAALIFLER